MTENKRPAAETDPSENTNDILLSAPWNDNMTQPAFRLKRSNQSNFVNLDEPPSDTVMETYLKERTYIRETYIKEQEESKRLGLLISFTLILSSALIVAFAPPGRETISYWIGGGLLIFAAGASGFKRIWGKTKNTPFGADIDKRNS